MLKLGVPHMEAAHEIVGLRCWDGQGTVRLLDADETLNAMLLERCMPGTPLRRLPEPEQDAVIGALLPRLWRTPPHGTPFRELAGSAEGYVLLFTDLHAGNVLRAQRAPWLAIDPKPFVGDPTYDATQHLFNCRRTRAAPRATIAAVADAFGLSRERLRLWTFARAAAEPRADWRNDVWCDVARRIAP